MEMALLLYRWVTLTLSQISRKYSYKQLLKYINPRRFQQQTQQITVVFETLMHILFDSGPQGGDITHNDSIVIIFGIRQLA